MHPRESLVKLRGEPYILTNHLRDRFKERFGWLKLEWEKGTNVLLKELMNESEPECSYLNNSAFMDYLYNKYGFDTRYEFMVNREHKIVFVVAIISEKNRTLRLVKTCYSASGTVFGVRRKYG